MNPISKQFIAFSVAITLLAFPLLGTSQIGGGTVQGIVTDQTGAIIPAAHVTVTSTTTAVERTSTSNSTGFYIVPDLQPGTYKATVGAAGFSTSEKDNLVVTVGANLTVNFLLSVGSSSTVVEVHAAVPTVDLATAQIGATVDSNTVRELPLNGRDWSQLITLEPGANSVRNVSAIGASTSASVNRVLRGFGNQMSISGMRPQQNTYLLDGISINDYTNGAPGGVLGTMSGVDSIQEFSVITTTYSPEFGKTSGGVINAVTRSGGNKFHGSAYEFIRNNAFDARNYFDGPSIAPFRRNQFGATAGGPIIRDKTFFFFNYEGLRQNLGISVSDLVPSQNARNGILSSGNVVVSPTVKPYLAFWPLPNAGLSTSGDIGNYRTAIAQIGNEDLYLGKLDHHFSSNDSLSGTYQYDSTHVSQPDPLNNLHFVNADTRTFLSIQETHIFSANTINRARVGFSRNAAMSNTGNAINPLAADISLGSVPGNPAPAISVPTWTTFNGGLGAYPNFTIAWNSFQYYDDAIWIHNTHTVKFGFGAERMQSNDKMHFRNDGSFSFASVNAFLTNTPRSYSVQLPAGNPERGIRESLFGFYGQDEWRIHQNLTLDYGVRYEITTVPTEVHDQLAVLRNMTDTTAHLGNPYFHNPTLKDLSPRIGFSWAPFRKSSTAIRGGIGVYDVLPLPYLYLITSAGSAPFTTNPNLVNLGQGTFPNQAFNIALNTVAQNSYAGERVSYLDPNPPRSLTYNWNLNVQQEIAANAIVTLAYVGSRGNHLPYHTDDADIVLPTMSPAGYIWPSGDNYKKGTKLNPLFGDINRTSWDADSYFHSLQAGFHQRMSHGLEIQASFTWGRSIDTGSSSVAGNQFSNSATSLPVWFDPRTRRGPSDFNLALNGVVSLIWQSPEVTTGTPLFKWGANGWQVGAIGQASTGAPFSVFIAGDPLGVNSSDPYEYPDRIHGTGCNSLVNPGKPNGYIKINCFAAPVQLIQTSKGPQPQIIRLGNAGRNELVGPGLSTLDFSLVKNSKISKLEAGTIQFRAEFFNILNRSNFAAPLGNVNIFNQDGSAANGGGVVDHTQTTSRQIQFALKILF